MGLLISSLVMVSIFLAVVATEWQCAKRTKAFFARTEPQLAQLADRATSKYRARFGKDPTHEIVIRPRATKKS